MIDQKNFDQSYCLDILDRRSGFRIFYVKGYSKGFVPHLLLLSNISFLFTPMVEVVLYHIVTVKLAQDEVI